jgi:hypothetical protein
MTQLRRLRKDLRMPLLHKCNNMRQFRRFQSQEKIFNCLKETIPRF